MRAYILLFLTVCCSLLSGITTETTGFRFNEKGKFTILQLIDMHYCHRLESQTQNETDAVDMKTQKLNRMLIRMAKPDLIVLGGDAITGRQGAKESGKQFEACWEKVIKVIKEFQIPYAYILGNHDAEGFWNREDIMKFDQTQPLSVRKGLEGIPDTCNFVLPIASSRNEEEIAANIWFFDSGSQSCSGFDYHTWGCVEKDTIDWYNYQSQRIKEEQGMKTHHLAFVHIPLPEFTELANHGEFSGVREEQIACPNINTGLFDHIKKNGDISGIFVGHDHKNNMAGWYQGIELAYGQKSGYGAYGHVTGARVIVLKEHYNQEGELKVSRNHHIIFANGTIAEPDSLRREDRGLIAECPIYGKDSSKTLLMKTQILLLLILCSLLSVTLANFKFNQQGKFTILQLTDLHFCHRLKNETRQQTNALDIQTQKLQRMLIHISKPDLIVLSGDAITGRRGAKKSGKQFEACWKKVIKVIKEFNIPYAYILGNHDAEGFWNREDIMKFDQTQPLSIRKGLWGIPDTCNFVVPVYSSRDEEKLAASLWMFDSGSQSCNGFDYYTWGCVEQDVIDWYNYQSQHITNKHGTKVHHLAFVHIPLPEFTELANHGEFSGVRDEQIGCPNINTGFFDHIKRNGDISGIFVGHDHKNNMAGWYQGVEFAYGQKSGYGAYGLERGARVITLKENYNEEGELKVTRNHHIIFENGTIARPSAPRKEDREVMAVCPIVGLSKIEKVVGSFSKSFWEIKNWIKQMIFA